MIPKVPVIEKFHRRTHIVSLTQDGLNSGQKVSIHDIISGENLSFEGNLYVAVASI